jgi:hypothetical protein
MIMPKIKITEVRELIFEPNLDYYHEGATLEEIMKIEKDAAESNPEYFDIFMENDQANSVVTVTIVEE